MITKEHISQFRDQGYFIMEKLFSDKEMDRLTVKIDEIVNAHHLKMTTTGQKSEGISRPNEITFTPTLVKKDVVFQQFCSQDKFVEITTKILGPDVSLYWDQAVYKRPETNKEFPWHQDNGYGLVLSEEYVTCWIALEDSLIENGCIWIIPHSHKDGIVEHRSTSIGWQCYFGDDPGIPVPLKKGSMVVFSSLLFHRSGPNVSDTIRKGYILQYYPTSAVNTKTKKPFLKMKIAKEGKAFLDTSDIEEQDK